MRNAAAFVAVLLAAAALAPEDASAREVTLPHSGLTLNATLEIAAGKSLADGVVMMVHGTMQHNDFSTMREFRTMLRTKGFSTLVVNLGLGVDNRRGMYDCERPSTHRFSDALDEIGAWLEWLQANGAKRVVLFGFSRGGQEGVTGEPGFHCSVTHRAGGTGSSWSARRRRSSRPPR